MKKLLIFLAVSLFSLALNAQAKVISRISSLCYKRGYLHYNLTFENTSDKELKFKQGVLSSKDESPYDDSLNVNLYRSGVQLFTLRDNNNVVLNWFDLSVKPYKCKKDKKEYFDFTLAPNEKISFSMILCLKKYEYLIKREKKCAISLKIFQNTEKSDAKNEEFYSGIIETNSQFFSSRRLK